MLRILVVIISYFLGNFLFARFFASIKRIDLKAKGSGNPGATNAYRILGPLSGIFTLVGDILKGIIGTYLGLMVGGTGTAALCGLAVVIGHNWPIIYGFQGGKGIATSLGVIIILMPKALLVLVPLWVIVFALSRYVSMASLAAAVALPLTHAWFYPGFGFSLLFVIVVSLLAIYRHQSNIRRLLTGEEHKVNLRSQHKSTQMRGREDQEEDK